MIIPVRCWSCGTVIGDKWDSFKERVKKGEKPKNVLDDLGIKRYCCRTVFLTHIELLDEIGKYRRA